MDTSEFKNYIANGRKLIILDQYQNKEMINASFIEPSLFVRLEFREITRQRYTLI